MCKKNEFFLNEALGFLISIKKRPKCGEKYPQTISQSLQIGFIDRPLIVTSNNSAIME